MQKVLGMKKITWKIQRETKRLVRQLMEIPNSVFEYLFLRLLYDFRKPHEMVVVKGIKPIAAEVAIYLIYAPNGLKKSHFDTLRTLTDENITPIIVSNLPLEQTDRELLVQQSGLVIERPNIGYDFGGYRDAIMQISEKLNDLDRLYILNDSVWMVDADQSWFSAARATGCEFVGATSNYGIARHNAAEFQNITWSHSAKHPNFHYASYALSIGDRILKNPKFLSYWRKFRITNSKKRTIKRGEIGLTQWVLKHGYEHCATCEVAKIDAEIASLDDISLDAVARNLVIPEDLRLIDILDRVLKSDPTSEKGRHDRYNVILMAVARQSIGYALPYFNLHYKNFQFIKKSPLKLSRRGAEATLQIMAELDGPMARHALIEAQQLFSEREDVRQVVSKS